MKRLLYLCSAIVLVTSFGLAGGRTLAARSAAPAQAPMQTVRLCVSLPFGVAAYVDLTNGMRRGVQLASGQWKARFRSINLNLVAPRALDSARSDGVDYGTDQERINALKCLSDRTIMGEVGPLNTGASDVSEPVYNRGHMVQISPANTGPRLTDPALRAAHEPVRPLTYFRTVTTDSVQGPAGAVFLNKKLNVKRFYLVDDKQAYGVGLAQKMTAWATSRLGMTQLGYGHVDPTDASSIASTADAVASAVVAAHPDGVYFGGNPPEATPMVKRLRAKGYTGPVMGGDAVFNQAYITTLGNSAANNFATSVGPDPLATGRSFRAQFTKAFHKPLGPYDAPAYDAANIILQSIYKAKKAGKFTGGATHQRLSILSYVHNAAFVGATGLTTFDKNGDTKNKIISTYAVIGSGWKFRGTAPTQGIASVP